MKWTKEDLEKAIELIKSGLTYAEIGVELNRKAYSIKTRLEKIGIKYHQFHEKQSIFETRICLHCGSEFKTRKCFENKFCNHSCAAKFNNPKNIRIPKNPNDEKSKKWRENYHARKKKECLNCGLTTSNKFCKGNCQSEFERKTKFALIESGDTSLKSHWSKKYLIHLHGNKCMMCGWCEVNPVSGKVPIELEHVDGHSENNNLDNLKLLCPNCHSLTPTYKGLNKGNGRHSRKERYRQGKSF